MREVTRRILARNGYHVVAAASGPDALNVLASQLEHIDVLLTDVVMPHMQGKELADKIRILQPTARVVFMSGYTQGLLGAQGVLESGVHLIENPSPKPPCSPKCTKSSAPITDRTPTFGRLPTARAVTISAGTSIPVALPEGSTVARNLMCALPSAWPTGCHAR